MLATGIPLLLVAYVGLRFYWWLSAYISRVAGWGSEFGWTRWFWFFVLAISTYLYLDPLDNIGRLIARVELVTNLGKYGLPTFNPMLLTFRLLLILFLVMALWNYLRQALLVAGCWLKETWRFCVSLLQGLAVTLSCFFRPNVCVEYPEYRSEIPPYFRGRHYLEIGENGRHLCGTCRACENICPDRLILISTVRNPETKKQELTGFLLDNSRCCFCGLCEDACPLSALKHSSEYEYSCYERRDLVLDLFSEYLERSNELRVKHGGANVG